MTTTADIGTLTRKEINLISQASRVTFRHWMDQDPASPESTGTIIFFNSDAEELGRISVATKVTDYDPQRNIAPTNTPYRYNAHFSGYYDSFSPLGSALRSLKTGDRISLHWLANNHNALMQIAHLTAHELRLYVNHAKGSRSNLLLSYQVTHIHSTAQMITRFR